MKNKSNNFLKNLMKSIRSSSGKNNAVPFDRFLYAIPIVILVVVVIFVAVKSVMPKSDTADVSDELYNKYANENNFKNRVYGEEQTPNMENEETPEAEEFAISVYGDSFCISNDAQVPSFPAYLSKYTNLTLVYNVASSNDSLEMVAAREGGLPMYISPCDIKSKKKKTEITLENEYGTSLVPDFSKNAGLNPCTVNGVEGVLSQEGDTLYFTRSESGYENIVATPTIVQTRAMQMRLNDVTVFFVGSDSIYSNSARTVDIFKRVVKNLGTDKYLIVGPVMGTKTEINSANEALSEAFGNKFLNLYEYLTNDALQEYEIEISDDEKNAIQESSTLPSVYLDTDDKNYFNEQGNDIVGKKVADTLRSLNYLK